jgi:hypothetical protein
MQVLEGSDAEDQAEGLQDVRLLMDCMARQLGGSSGGAVANFEFCQGLLQLILQVRRRLQPRPGHSPVLCLQTVQCVMYELQRLLHSIFVSIARLPPQVHGDTIMAQPELVAEARRLQVALQPAWLRVEGLLQAVRCMVQYFGNLQ